MIHALLHACDNLASMLPTVLAWRPMLDPLPIERFWLVLLLPLAVAIALVYKVIKLDNLARLPRQAGVLSAQIVVLMSLAALAIWIVVEAV